MWNAAGAHLLAFCLLDAERQDVPVHVQLDFGFADARDIRLDLEGVLLLHACKEEMVRIGICCRDLTYGGQCALKTICDAI